MGGSSTDRRAGRSRLRLGVAQGLASFAGTCDRIYQLKREAPLSAWPDPDCVERRLRAEPSLGDVTAIGPYPSSDDARLTLHTFGVATPEIEVRLWLQTDVAHEDMDISLHWSRLNRRPADAEVNKITGLMNVIEERVRACRGVPQPAAFKSNQNW
jgi:hypothetical protein